MNKFKFIAAALACAGLLAPSAAFAICNGVGNNCTSSYSSSYTQPYTRYQQYMPQQQYQYPQYQYQQQQQYQSYSNYGYNMQPVYFPLTLSFPTAMQSSYSQYSQYNPYSYGQNYYPNYWGY